MAEQQPGGIREVEVPVVIVRRGFQKELMKNTEKKGRKNISIVLAIVMIISLIPFGVFADAEQDYLSIEEDQISEAGSLIEDNSAAPDETAENAAIAAEVDAGYKSDMTAAEEKEEDKPEEPAASKEPIDTGDAGISEFVQDGFSLRFRTVDVLTEKPLGSSYKPKSAIFKMVKGGGRKITWTVAKNDAKLDGYIVLRKKDDAAQYTEIATTAAGRTSYTDKKAVSKDKSKYKYIIAGFRREGETVRISHCCTAEFRRVYQNPAKYVQIKDKISKHGLKYYTSPVLTDASCTRKDHIEAMIKTAYKYKGDRYVVCKSDKPGKGLDCSGLVMQACYGAGVDLWPSNPYRHKKPAYEYESRNIAKMKNLKTISFSKRKRGDLIFFSNSVGTIIHVAIYLGNDKIIHSTSVGMRVIVSGMGGGAYGRPCKVKRIFN